MLVTNGIYGKITGHGSVGKIAYTLHFELSDCIPISKTIWASLGQYSSGFNVFLQ